MRWTGVRTLRRSCQAGYAPIHLGIEVQVVKDKREALQSRSSLGRTRRYQSLLVSFLQLVPNESGKYRTEAGHSAVETPFAEASACDSTVWPCNSFRLRGARRGALHGALPRP